MIRSKSMGQSFKEEQARAEANNLFNLVDNSIIELEKEERPRDSLSVPLNPISLRIPTPNEVKQIMNHDIPKKWRKNISKVVWK